MPKLHAGWPCGVANHFGAPAGGDDETQKRKRMPTINQLVKSGRDKQKRKTAAPALRIALESFFDCGWLD